MRNLHVELVCRADSVAEFARLVTAWLTEAKAELFPELDRELPAGRVLKAPVPGDPSVPIGPPGATWATVFVQPDPEKPAVRTAVYSGASWRRLLDGLETEHPFALHLSMAPLDSRGAPVHRYDAASVGVRRHREDPGSVRLQMQASPGVVPWPGSAEIQRRWTEFLRDWAVRLGASYGHVTDDADWVNGTALEQAVRSQSADLVAVPRQRQLLRGYSWVTVCAAELVSRLGGVEALAASGAFHEVRELSDGQVFLQATPLLEQYEGTAVREVFEALAPVLVMGEARSVLAGPAMRLVLDVDADDFR